MPITFQRTYPPAEVPSYPALWLLFNKNKIIIQRNSPENQDKKETFSIPQGDEALLAGIEHEEIAYLGLLGDLPCVATFLKEGSQLPPHWQEVGIRELYSYLSEIEFELAGYAHQIIHWQRTNRYCPYCTTRLTTIPGHWGHECPNGHYIAYPPVVPAMIVLVHDNERVLLAHKAGWGKRYGLFAGFVEPGETIEECIQRELKEEAGIEITDLHYVRSQAWPFPDQLMIGFTARYAGGTPQPQDNELDKVAWFSQEKLPAELPPPYSLAYMLINDWLDRRTPTQSVVQQQPDSNKI
jgi:NTP pyrophosphohydrolases containing a Zn-finger, probably nucleic-acid-binding